jgi:hypothetical protein
MVVAGKAGTTVFFMVTLMAAATLVTRALRAIVALATASQDMPALAGMMAGLDMAEAGMVAGLDMAAEAGMVAGATTDDQDQEVRQQQPAFTRTAAKYPNPSRQRHGRHSEPLTHSTVRPRLRIAAVGTRSLAESYDPPSQPLELFMLLTA